MSINRQHKGERATRQAPMHTRNQPIGGIVRHTRDEGSDFLLQTKTGFVVVDVKPEQMRTDPGVSAPLDWAGRVCTAKGWRFEVWSGANPAVLRNVRFLAAGRRADLLEAVLVKAAETLRPGMSVAEAERGLRARSASCPRCAAVAAVAGLLDD